MSHRIPSLFAAGLFALQFCMAAPAMAASEENDAPRAEGTWQGALELSGQRLRLVVHIHRGPDGALAGTLDSIDQRATGVPLDAINLTEDVLSFQITQIGGRFAGNFHGDDTI